jgi:hypothetical protein
MQATIMRHGRGRPQIVYAAVPGPVTRVSAVAFALAAAALTPHTAFSQSPSILELLPTADQRVEIGTERAGMLTASDYATTDGRRVQAFELVGERGQPVTIDAVSDDFDAFLYVVGPGYDEPQMDDDSGGQCHARLSLFLPDSGTFRVVVGSLGGGTGGFTLFVGDRQRPMAEGGCGEDAEEEAALLDRLLELEAQATLAVGDTVASSLSTGGPSLPDGSPAEAWLVTGEAGQTVVVDLVSVDFDALLYTVRPAIEAYESDDDSGGACNSRLTLTFDSSDPIRLVATSLGGRSACRVGSPRALVLVTRRLRAGRLAWLFGCTPLRGTPDSRWRSD